MDALKSNCFRCKSQSVLGIYRTFNLGKVFVTVNSFKQTSLVNEYGRHPIILGPMLLHGDCTSNIYAAFLHHIATVVGYDKLQKSIIGSDDEKAIRKAIRETIPQANNVLRTLHLRRNFDDHLKNKRG